MRLLRLAIETQRWDLAACTVILAVARLLKDGDKKDARKSGEKKALDQGERRG